MTQMTLVVFLAVLMWDVSGSTTWDYRFHESTSPTNNQASSKIIHEPSSSRTLYSEGEETVLQDMKSGAQNRTMNTSRTNVTQTTIPVMSEGGGSDHVYFDDKNVTNHRRKHVFQNEENGNDESNSTLYDSVNKDHEDSTALQTLSRSQAAQLLNKTDMSNEVNSRTSRVQKSHTALAVVGRSLEEHHTESPGPRSDAVSSYYDFLVNEGSYKFWSVFQVFTAALLIYSAFAAVYYAKYTFATMDYPDYLDDGFFFRRSGADRAQGDDVYYDYEDEDTVTTPRPQQSTFLGMSSATFQRIMDALSSKKYS